MTRIDADGDEIHTAVYSQVDNGWYCEECTAEQGQPVAHDDCRALRTDRPIGATAVTRTATDRSRLEMTHAAARFVVVKPTAADHAELDRLASAIGEASRADLAAGQVDPAWDMFGPGYDVWDDAVRAFEARAATHGLCRYPRCRKPVDHHYRGSVGSCNRDGDHSDVL